MTIDNTESGDVSALRRRAEVTAGDGADLSGTSPVSQSAEEIQQALHELHVHQVELEMQNEELRRTQLELEAARTRYFDLYDLAPVGYVTVSEKGLILEANLTAATLLGVPRAVLIKERFARFVLNEDQDLHYLHRKKLLENGEPQSYILRMLKGDGTSFWARLQAAAPLGEGIARARRIVLTDISEQVHAQEEVRVRRQQLMQADKMVSLGILVAGVAHEINNPNHSIMANVTVLAEVWAGARPILDRFYEDFGDFVLGGYEYTECRDKLPDMFASALDNSRRIQLIVNELRDFARHSPKESMAPVDVNAVVKSANILLHNMVKKSTNHFFAEYREGLPTVMGNFRRIEQVVINLVQNACQSLDARDRAVSVATSHDPASDSVLIEVCDEGGGIPEENVNMLGTPFFTTKRDEKGMGLGLWICQNIAHEHGGALTFSPAEGGGIRAVLALPANRHLPVVEPVEYEL